MKTFVAGLVALPFFLATVPEGLAESLTSDTVLRSLARTPGVATRSLKPSARALTAADADYLSRLPSRGLRIDMKDKLADIVERNDLPRLDIDIRFAYDSTEISARSRADLDALGVALLADSLIDARIAINGHTDAAGNDAYNLGLSERRAEAVKDYLTRHHGIDEERLIAVGFGERRLKNTTHPQAA